MTQQFLVGVFPLEMKIHPHKDSCMSVVIRSPNWTQVPAETRCALYVQESSVA